MESYQDYYGEFGGRYVAEVLRTPLDQLEIAYREAVVDTAFLKEIEQVLQSYVGRPTPLMHAENLSKRLGGAQIYVKENLL